MSDPEALARWLEGPLAVVSGGPVDDIALSPFERPAAGRSSDTLLFSMSWSDGGGRRSLDGVLRRQPEGGIFLRPDVVRECRVLEGLARGSGVPVPRVLGCEEGDDVLGAPFFVMEHVAGRVPAARPSIHAVGWLPTLTVAERERLWRSAMDVLVAIHAVDWRSTHAFLVDGDAGPVAGVTPYVDRLLEWYQWSVAGRRFPITDAAVEAIAAHRPSVTGGEPVLVWGDARPGNMIFGADHRCAAAIDWELATIGPPEIDLAHWLFFDAFATTACGVDRLPGWPDRAATIDCYEELSGRRMADLELFELLEELVIATTLIRQSDLRVSRGLAAPDTRMGHDNAVTQMIARRLGLPLPELSPDYLAHRAG